MCIIDLSSDVCSSDLRRQNPRRLGKSRQRAGALVRALRGGEGRMVRLPGNDAVRRSEASPRARQASHPARSATHSVERAMRQRHTIERPDHLEYGFWLTFTRAGEVRLTRGIPSTGPGERAMSRSEEHTSEIQPLMRISYAVFCLK